MYVCMHVYIIYVFLHCLLTTCMYVLLHSYIIVIMLLLYCNHLIRTTNWLFPACVTLQFVTPVRRLALRILYTHAVYTFILIRRLAKEEVHSPSLSDLFWLFGTKCLLEQRVSAK
jgi:hypothetical protein